MNSESEHDFELNFELIESLINNLKTDKQNEFTDLHHRLTKLNTNLNLLYESVLNDCRKDLLHDLLSRKNESFRTSRLAAKLAFNSNLNNSNLCQILVNQLVIKNGFNLNKKLKYLHLLDSKEYFDIELYDIKSPKSMISYSSIISSNRIFLVIKSDRDNDFIFQVHQINKSSFRTCRQILKKNVRRFEFVFVNNLIFGLLFYCNRDLKIEIYDFELNFVKSMQIEDHGVTQFITNGSELILDYYHTHAVYDFGLKEKESFKSCLLNCTLVNLTKDYLVYVYKVFDDIEKPIKIECRFTRDLIFVIKAFQSLGIDPVLNFKIYHLVDYESNFYFKFEKSNQIYSIELNKKSVANNENRISILQDKSDLSEFNFSSLRNYSEETILFYKNRSSWLKVLKKVLIV